MSDYSSLSGRRRLPLTFWMGLLIILLCQGFLLADVLLSKRGALHNQTQIAALKATVLPATALAMVARWVAVNMTGLVWAGYLLLLEGLLHRQRPGSPARRRPHHFMALCLASVLIWCVFDGINFYSIRAWRYIGLPEPFYRRLPGYFVAFAAIVPAMLMSGQVLLNASFFDWARTKSRPLPRWLAWVWLAAGLAMFLWPLVYHDPVTNLTLWISLVFLLDPINYFLGRPSMFRDWSNGWFGRTLAAFSGGLICGLLWEFWNYWALAKWVYRLPFLGASENVRYFEMPILGLLGFIPFGIECWIMWQTIRIILNGLAEPLPDEKSLL